MTWKHLMLGAVHNTTTGQHRSAKEMELELSRLVCWRPPEDLKKDCSKWRERCKICVSVYAAPRHEPGPAESQARDILDLPPDGEISVRDIKRHFRHLAKTLHPDKGGTDMAFVALHDAFETLMEIYDDSLNVG